MTHNTKDDFCWSLLHTMINEQFLAGYLWQLKCFPEILSSSIIYISCRICKLCLSLSCCFSHTVKKPMLFYIYISECNSVFYESNKNMLKIKLSKVYVGLGCVCFYTLLTGSEIYMPIMVLKALTIICK